MVSTVCYRCDVQYALDPSRDRLYVCLDNICHYFNTHCPNCLLIEHTFLTPHMVIEALTQGIPYSFIEEAPEELLMEFDEACTHEMIEEAVCAELENILRRRQPELGRAMPTWNGKESQTEKNARLSKERRQELLEEVDGFLEVVSPIHPLKEHFHGEVLNWLFKIDWRIPIPPKRHRRN